MSAVDSRCQCGLKTVNNPKTFADGVTRKRSGRHPLQSILQRAIGAFNKHMATGHNRLGAHAYVNSTPKSDIAAEAARQFSKPQAAIVESATKKDWVYYETAINEAEEHCGKLYREYRESKVWKAQYKTWEDACVPLGKSRRQVDRDIHAEEKRTECPNTDHKVESDCLNKVEEARKEKEEPEKPAVHSADEKSVKPETNGHAPEPKRSQNGKPKRDLALWGEIEGLLGKSMNRADELNRQCPNSIFHEDFIVEVKTCMETLSQWRETVQ